MGGATGSECTQAAPCATIERALSLQPPRKFILVGTGTYTSATALSFDGERRLIGTSTSRPRITRSSPGPIVDLVAAVVDVSFENVEVSGATGSDGHGIQCVGNGSSTLEVRDIIVKENAGWGVRTSTCSLHATDSEFLSNGDLGISVTDSNATIDRCMVLGNIGGVNLDSGLFAVTNNFIARNGRTGSVGIFGLAIYGTTGGHRIEFNTIVDNTNDSTAYGGGFECNLQGGAAASFSNNIIARNSPFQATGTGCTFPGSIIQADLTGLAFKSAEVAPYDYHLTASSSAIDQASASTLAHDFDGDARPQGAGRDVGADEFVP